MMGNDGMDDVTILVNSSPDKLMGLNLSFANGFPSVSNSVLCAKASMLLQVRMLQMLFLLEELFLEVYTFFLLIVYNLYFLAVCACSWCDAYFGGPSPTSHLLKLKVMILSEYYMTFALLQLYINVFIWQVNFIFFLFALRCTSFRMYLLLFFFVSCGSTDQNGLTAALTPTPLQLLKLVPVAYVDLE